MIDSSAKIGWFINGLNCHSSTLWWITETSLTHVERNGPYNVQAIKPTRELENGHNIWEYMLHAFKQMGYRSGLPDPKAFTKLDVEPNKFHFRIARPLFSENSQELFYPGRAEDLNYIISARNNLVILVRQLESICRVVEPLNDTPDKIYGLEIRNLIILSSTEVEMYFRGILEKNGNTGGFNTKSYAKLAEPLHLKEYSVGFNLFPDMQRVKPFFGWDITKPTQSLPWYDAYNGIKHNRENEFHRATLACAFNALASCIILFVAQFGKSNLTEEILYFFDIDEPNWRAEEVYIGPRHSGTWEGTKYFETHRE